MSFQKAVKSYQAPAVAGDFAAHNPNASMLSGEGTLVSGTDGVTVGVFAWADADGKVSNKKTAGARIGFVHREQQASITAYLAEHGNQILPGQIITLAVAGDFWAHFPTGAEIGQNVFAKRHRRHIESICRCHRNRPHPDPLQGGFQSRSGRTGQNHHMGVTIK